MRKHSFDSLAILFMLFICMLTSKATLANAESVDVRHYFNIPRQSADLGLTALGQQADITVLYQYDVVQRHSVNLLLGSYTLRKAVSILLANTGLKGEFDPVGHLIITQDHSESGKHMKTHKNILASMIGFFISSGGAHIVNAQESAGTDDDQLLALEEVIITGSRRANRSELDTLAPVDVISSDDFRRLGNTDTNAALRSLVPSFNVAQQPNFDESSFIRPANLRSLPPDNTLILVNGKRRHRGAVISFLGSGVSDGAQGADISAIPGIALKQVEVLRDGAAAQYGSDAIAGVINFRLKDASEGGSVEMRYGEFYEGDGDAFQVSGNIGLPLTDRGFINLSADYSFSEATARQVQRSDAAALIAAGNTSVADPAMTWGAPDVDDNYRLFFNSGITLSDAAEFYSFGNYATKEVDTVFYYRNPNTRGGVFTNDGGETLLVGDLNTENAVNCPTINIVNNVPDQAALAQISAGGALANECFAFNEIFPGGFTPHMGGTVDDTAVAFGVRGDITDSLYYDVSLSWGQSAVDFNLRDSVNPSLGPNSPTEFKLGENIQTDTSFNIDLTYSMPVSFFASDLNVATGFEWRDEEYEVKSGDPASFANGPLEIQGFSSGSNGFSGFGAQTVGTFARDNIALYLDLETDVTDALTLGAAMRWEDFEDFGSTTNYKLSGRYNITDSVAVRSTLSTGFRAPTPGQSNVIRTSTQGLIIDGEFVFRESGILPPTNPVVNELSSLVDGGIQAEALRPEESKNFTLGFVFDLAALNITVDYFHIKVEDRISLTNSFSIDNTDPTQAAVLQDLSARGVVGATSLNGFRFFTNDFETTTKGVDIVASLPIDLGAGDSKLLFAFNHTETELARLTDVVDSTRKTQLEEALPENRFTLTGTHSQGSWSYLARLNYYDSFVVATDQSSTFNGGYGENFLVDAEINYHWRDSLTLSLGAQNIFDETPDEHPTPADNSGQIYPEESPFGFNGGFYYLRVTHEF